MEKKIKLLIINGPNLNMLGLREPGIYGDKTLDDINNLIKENVDASKYELIFFQSNIEGEIINFIQNNKSANGMIINPAAFTHTSISIRDSITATAIPTIEVHLSNIHSREDFRKHSYIAPVCIGQISGFGYNSYLLGIQAMINHLKQISKR